MKTKAYQPAQIIGQTLFPGCPLQVAADRINQHEGLVIALHKISKLRGKSSVGLAVEAVEIAKAALKAVS